MRQLTLLIMLLLTAAQAFASAPNSMSIAPMLKKVMPAIVNVRVQGEVTLPPELKFNTPYSRQRPNQRNTPPNLHKIQQLGSGVIIDAKKGYIITNAHVVKYAKEISVTLNDSRIFPAKLVGADVASDIAILKIKAKDLHSLSIGNSDKLQVGDFVAAIGSPYGLNQTVTSGIVSALQRNNLNIEGYENFIQTDAAINPGNSGGALVTASGKLIGINTAIISPMGGNIGIGFAIPINMAHSIMEQIIKYGEVRRGLLGIFAQPLTPDLREAFGLSNNREGTVITSVAPDSPAANAGLDVGDVILSINHQKVKNPFEVRNIIGLLRVNSHIVLDILRNGKTLTKKAIITGSKTQQEEMKTKQPFLSGVSLSDVNNIESAMHGAIKGVQVLSVADPSPAALAGLLPGDIIVSANKKSISNMKELFESSKHSKHRLLLNIIRGPGALFIVIK